MSPPDAPRTATCPPRLAEALLGLSVKDRNARDGLLGDLQEEYTRLLNRRGTARLPRFIWYGLAVLGLTGRFLLARLPGFGGVGSRRPASGDGPRRTGVIDELRQDIRGALRMLGNNPGFTAVAVLSLGLGIAATSTVFGLANATFLRPPPFVDEDRLVLILHLRDKHLYRSWQQWPTFATFLEFRERNTVFEQLAWTDSGYSRVTNPGLVGGERYGLTLVDPNLLRVLGVDPILGRHFVPEDALKVPRSAAPTVGAGIMISHAIWQRRFGGDPGIVGQRWGPNMVIGVMPEGFRYLILPPDISWQAVSSERADLEARKAYGWERLGPLVGRLKPGVTLEQAQAELQAIAEDVDQLQDGDGWHLSVMTLQQYRLMREHFRRGYRLLFPSVAALLVIACANVASLLMARAASRQQEITTRAALGAGRSRLIRQLLTESLVLASLGGVLGTLLTFFGTRLFLLLEPRPLTFGFFHDGVPLDTAVVGFTLAISFLTVVVFGLAPALRISRVELSRSLNTGGRYSTGRPSRRVGGLLVVTQIALAIILLTGTGLMIKSLVRLDRYDRGFDPENLLTASIALEGPDYQSRAPGPVVSVTPQVSIFYRQVMDRVKQLPGVVSVATHSTDWLCIATRGHPLPPDTRCTAAGGAEYDAVSLGYFETVGASLLRGRLFTEQDTRAAPWVAIVNDSFAEIHFPGEDPIGQLVQAQLSKVPDVENDRPREIVGVISHIQENGVAEEPWDRVYVPDTQHLWAYTGARAEWWVHVNRNLIARTTVDPLTLSDAVRRVVADVDDRQAIEFTTANEQIRTSFQAPRFVMRVLMVLATLAAFLAAIGIYGVISYSVAARTHEIGVRRALGAQEPAVLGMMIRQGMVLVGAGIVVGVAGFIAATRLIANQLYVDARSITFVMAPSGVEPTDPLTFTVVAVLLAAIALLATYVPARNATKVDPLIALRSE